MHVYTYLKFSVITANSITDFEFHSQPKMLSITNVTNSHAIQCHIHMIYKVSKNIYQVS